MTLPELEEVFSDHRCSLCKGTDVTYYGVCNDCRDKDLIPDTDKIVIYSEKSVRALLQDVEKRLNESYLILFNDDDITDDKSCDAVFELRELLSELRGVQNK